MCEFRGRSLLRRPLFPLSAFPFVVLCARLASTPPTFKLRSSRLLLFFIFIFSLSTTPFLILLTPSSWVYLFVFRPCLVYILGTLCSVPHVYTLLLVHLAIPQRNHGPLQKQIKLEIGPTPTICIFFLRRQSRLRCSFLFFASRFIYSCFKIFSVRDALASLASPPDLRTTSAVATFSRQPRPPPHLLARWFRIQGLRALCLGPGGFVRGLQGVYFFP